jgi:hypothetical protein
MYPDDEYLTKIGRLAYLVSYVEWAVLGDLPRLSLPDPLNARALMDGTTGTIAGRIERSLPLVTDPAVAAWLAEAVKTLREVSRIRNDMLHARPATIDGEPRLLRYRADPHYSFTVTDQWLEDAEAQVGVALRRLNSLRLPFA